MSSELIYRRLEAVVSLKTGKLDSNAAEPGGRFPFFTCSPTTLEINSFAFDTEAVILAGNNANGVFAIKHFSGKFNAYQRTYVIEPLDQESTSCKYLYYVISDSVSRLKELSVGSATKFLTKTILNDLQIPLPSKYAQDNIANFLMALDDRINQLRETNATLEAIAQTLFKSWFVDFDPVRAKAEGRQPEGIDSATAALFPDTFEDSELGPIPKGWGVVPLSDLLEAQIGGVWGEEFATEKSTVSVSCMRGIDAVDIRAGRVPVVPKRWVSQKQIESRVLKEGDILVEGSGSFCGRSLYWIDSYAELLPLRPTYSNFVKRIASPRGHEVSYWAALHLSQVYESGEISNFRIGSAFPNLDLSGLLSKKVVCPALGSITICFYDLVRPLLEAQKQNILRVATLSALRDTLLPRLISGQLRLPEAEAQLEEALV